MLINLLCSCLNLFQGQHWASAFSTKASCALEGMQNSFPLALHYYREFTHNNKKWTDFQIRGWLLQPNSTLVSFFLEIKHWLCQQTYQWLCSVSHTALMTLSALVSLSVCQTCFHGIHATVKPGWQKEVEIRKKLYESVASDVGKGVKSYFSNTIKFWFGLNTLRIKMVEFNKCWTFCCTN